MSQHDLFRTPEAIDDQYRSIERRLWHSGFYTLCGVDEAGRGPLAGPVVACACILPHRSSSRFRDSKVVPQPERQKLYKKLISDARVIYSFSVIDAATIDEINILRATLLAMKKAIETLSKKPDFVLIDGRDAPPISIPCQPVIKGDSHCRSIAAASIIAKEVRDQIMNEYHDKYPDWGFREHKGYGTKEHLAAIEKYGLCPIHRRSFEPVGRVADKTELTLF
jgi:ribonuclease HII